MGGKSHVGTDITGAFWGGGGSHVGTDITGAFLVNSHTDTD